MQADEAVLIRCFDSAREGARAVFRAYRLRRSDLAARRPAAREH